ncbi:MAG TPA: DUF6152 family protein [Candidatus Acidoferrales bacterium]|nr:DUF6152 family protein [Candidatus Acidoferrales bacterium]
MKRNFLKLFALAIGVPIFLLPVWAHHGNAAYDTEKKITVKGTVTQWIWANPHCILQFDATDESGQTVHWSTETENPTTMSHSGWSKTSFKTGDEVSVTAIVVKNGKTIGRIVEVVLPNGQKLQGRVIPALPAYNPEEPPKH